jgi:enamine deaminase RidA (YjgF/YER057c/UK114 family)
MFYWRRPLRASRQSQISQGETPMVRPLFTTRATKPFSAYSQAIEVEAGERLVFVSGQVGTDPEGKLGDTERRQHELAWANVFAIIEAAGLSRENLVEATVYITDAASVGLYREVRDQALNGTRPAMTLLVVSGLADARFKVEISAVAAGQA